MSAILPGRKARAQNSARMAYGCFQIWIRWFGPMKVLASDQEGSLVSELVSVACEKFDIQREFGGSQEVPQTD